MTIAGLPLESWLLVGAAVGIGLAIEVAFFVAQRRARRSGGTGRPPASGAPADPPSRGRPAP